MALDLKENDLIKDRYRLVRVLGHGGFSVVWLAEDVYTDTEVAVKVFAPDKGLDKNGMNQFQKEYRRTRGLRHPYLLVPDHFDILDNNSPVLVLPFCSKGSLTDRIYASENITEPEIAKLLVQVGSALEELHKKGIIHQDIKPDNILIDEQGNYQLTDFGISRQMRSTLNKATANQSYMTMAYSPPERFISNPIDTPAGDIFSLGVMIYEMATGKVPWDGLGGVVLNGGAQIPNLPETYSKRLNNLIHNCLDPEYDKRPTAKELKAIGEKFLAEGGWPEITISENIKASSSSIEASFNENLSSNENSSRETQKISRPVVKNEINEAPGEQKPVIIKKHKKLELTIVLFFFTMLGISGYFLVAEPSSFSAVNLEEKYEKAYVSYTTTTNYEETFIRLKKLADEGHVPAYYLLGTYYEFGRGVKEDKEKAQFYFEKAISEGDKKANFGLGSLKWNAGKKEEANKFFALAYDTIEETANSGDAISMLQLGFLLAYTECCEGSLDEKLGFQFYKKAAENGYIVSQYQLGYMYLNGIGVDKDEKAAANWFEKAATSGYADAQTQIGYMYGEGIGVPENQEKAVEWYRKAAENNNSVGQYNLGIKYQYGKGIVKDEKEAVKWFEKAAEQGDADAQNKMGYLYRNGIGVSENDTIAFEWYRKAAENNHYVGQNELGIMYQYGKGVNKNEKEAVKWFGMSAEQGYPAAQNQMGYMYLNGLGVLKNYAIAIDWFRKAANQGNALGQYNMGIMYHNGFGVSENLKTAAVWYRKAAEQGNAMGQYNLGIMYIYGMGVTQDWNTAKYWIQKAAKQGNENAKSFIKRRKW